MTDAVTGDLGSSDTRPIRLPRPGRRAFLFKGADVISVTGWREDVPSWHEISLYRTANGAAVVEIRFHVKASESDSYVIVQPLPDLRAAVTYVEEHDPAEKIVATALSNGGPEGSMSMLRNNVQDVRRRYRELALEVIQQPMGDEEFQG